MIYSHKQKIKQTLYVERRGVDVEKELQNIHQTINGDSLSSLALEGVGHQDFDFLFYKTL